VPTIEGRGRNSEHPVEQALAIPHRTFHSVTNLKLIAKLCQLKRLVFAKLIICPGSPEQVNGLTAPVLTQISLMIMAKQQTIPIFL
jgi:hypothetical protein